MSAAKPPSTTSPPSVTNWSMLSIPAAYLLALEPHYYAWARGMIASGYQVTNLLPRTNLELLKSKISETTWKHLVRARGAHLNALEGFPLFAGAMIAGNWAGVSTKDLNLAAAEYLGVRVLYTALYMTVKSEAASYLRSGAYAWSLGIPCWVIWKAHLKVNGRATGPEDEKVRGAVVGQEGGSKAYM